MKRPPKIAIHAHAFYPAIWPEIQQCILNIIAVCGSDNVFLCITHPEGHDEIANVVTRDTYACNFRTVAFPNRGYDVAPFICEFLNKLNLDDYDYIVKLHTKRDVDTWINFRPLKDNEWRKALLFFCSSQYAVQKALHAFKRYEKLGMMANHKIINYCGSDLGNSILEAKDLCSKEFGFTPRHLVTASGTMFIVRSQLLKCFKGKYSINDFSPADTALSRRNYGLAALLEFAFTLRVDALEYIISEGNYCPTIAKFGYMIQSMLFRTLRCIRQLLEPRATVNIKKPN